MLPLPVLGSCLYNESSWGQDERSSPLQKSLETWLSPLVQRPYLLVTSSQL